MYLTHFGLRELPFSLTPDTSFFLNRSGYQDALNVLLVALRAGEGFVKVTGEVGTGKTLLCRKLINTLGGEFVSAYIHNPYLEPTELLDAVAEELGLAKLAGDGQHTRSKQLADALVEHHRQGRRVVVCLDEAQAMPVPTLEALRLLTNLETEKRKLVQVVLFGQPELDRLLACESIRQLRQRITFSYELRPMSRAALGTYVRHRLAVAAQATPLEIQERAIDLLHQFSGGVPRLVNILCHKALIAAYGRGDQALRAETIKLAAQDTPTARGARSGPAASRWRAGALGRAGIVSAVLGAAASAAYLAS